MCSTSTIRAHAVQLAAVGWSADLWHTDAHRLAFAGDAVAQRLVLTALQLVLAIGAAALAADAAARSAWLAILEAAAADVLAEATAPPLAPLSAWDGGRVARIFTAAVTRRAPRRRG